MCQNILEARKPVWLWGTWNKVGYDLVLNKCEASTLWNHEIWWREQTLQRENQDSKAEPVTSVCGWRASHWALWDWFPHLPTEVCTLYYSSCWNLSDIIYVNYEILWAVLRIIPHSTNICFVLMGQGLSIWETTVGQEQKSCIHMHTHTHKTQACTHNRRSSWSSHFFFLSLFIWLHQVLVMAQRIFHLHGSMQDL